MEGIKKTGIGCFFIAGVLLLLGSGYLMLYNANDVNGGSGLVQNTSLVGAAIGIGMMAVSMITYSPVQHTERPVTSDGTPDTRSRWTPVGKIFKLLILAFSCVMCLAVGSFLGFFP